MLILKRKARQAGTSESEQGLGLGLGEPLGASPLPWIMTWVGKRFRGLGGAHGERRLEVVERLELGGRRQLMLVLCDGQRYLVGAGGDGVQSIAAMRSGPAESLRLPAMGGGLGADQADVASDSKREMRCSF